MEKILSGTINGKKWNPQSSSEVSNIPVKAEESWPDYALRMGYTGAKSAVKGATMPLQLLGSAVTSALPTDIQQTLANAPRQEGVFQQAEKKLPETYAKEPEGFWENVYAKTSEQLPFLLLGGPAAALKSIPSAIGSSIGLQTAQDAGVGLLGQFAASMAGGGVVSGLKGFKGDPVSWARRTYTQDYKKLNDLLAKNPLVGDATDLSNALHGIEYEISKRYDNVSKQIRPYLKKSLNDIYGGRITFADANQKMKSLKKALRDNSIKGDESRDFASKMVSAYEDHLSTEGAIHPEYGIPYERSKNLYAADKGTAFLRHFSRKNTKEIKDITNSAWTPSLLQMILGKSGKAIDFALKPIIAGGARVAKDLDLLLTNPHVQEKMKDLITSASLGDKTALISRIGQLDKAVLNVIPSNEIILSGIFKAVE